MALSKYVDSFTRRGLYHIFFFTIPDLIGMHSGNDCIFLCSCIIWGPPHGYDLRWFCYCTNVHFRNHLISYLSGYLKVWLLWWQVKLVKCIVQNIVVDISFNQLGGLCTLCFLEKVGYIVRIWVWIKAIYLQVNWAHLHIDKIKNCSLSH